MQYKIIIWLPIPSWLNKKCEPHWVSSSLLWMIASLILLISFLPLYYPCLIPIFLATLGHPSVFSEDLSSDRIFYCFCAFYSFRWFVYSSFLLKNSSKSLLPSSFRFNFNSYSSFYKLDQLIIKIKDTALTLSCYWIRSSSSLMAFAV